MPDIKILNPDSLGQAARAIFANHARQGVGVPVHRRPGRRRQRRQDAGRFRRPVRADVRQYRRRRFPRRARASQILWNSRPYLVHSQDIPKFMAYRTREFPKLFAGGAYPPNTLLMIDRLVQEQFLIEVSAVAAL